jgi:excisionase family DNA binding protein
MRQSGGKQEPPHGQPSHRGEHSAPPSPPTAKRFDQPPAGGDLACPPNRGTTPLPPLQSGRSDAHPASDTSALSDASRSGGDVGKRWLTLADVAEELDVSTRTVMRWVERGQFPAVVLPGGRRRIHREAFERWLAALARAGGEG